MKLSINLFNRVSLLNVDLQHLIVITFPKSQYYHQLYLYLRDDFEPNIFSSKLKTHVVYSKSICSHLDVPSIIVYYPNGQISVKKWYNRNEELHRESGCAYIKYNKNGQIESQSWWKNGNLHRDTVHDGPAYIHYYDNGQFDYLEWHKNGKCHREGDKCARISYYYGGHLHAELWYTNGKKHREGNKPACIYYNNFGEIRTKEWWDNGVLQYTTY